LNPVLILPSQLSEDALAEMVGHPGFLETEFHSTLVLLTPTHKMANLSEVHKRQG
jgi:hypothetical protein